MDEREKKRAEIVDLLNQSSRPRSPRQKTGTACADSREREFQSYQCRRQRADREDTRGCGVREQPSSLERRFGRSAEESLVRRDYQLGSVRERSISSRMNCLPWYRRNLADA
jgi:hypothetical protein